MFGLGCVLLETGLWTSLQTILEQASGKPDLPTRLGANTCRQKHNFFTMGKNLSFHAGDTSKEVAILCLYADDYYLDHEDLGIQDLDCG